MGKRKIVFFSGAGLSAGSGIATFRTKGGLWENNKISQVCHAATWRANYELVQEFYSDRREQLRDVEPNAAHRLITQYQQDDRFDVKIITQNVDDLLERAGCTDVVHVHGRLTEMKCVACGNVWDIGYDRWEPGSRCPKCDSAKGTRPNVVFFEEAAPEYDTMLDICADTAPNDLVVIIGTSGTVVQPTRLLEEAHPLVLSYLFNTELGMNLESDFGEVIYGPAEHTLAPKLLEVLGSREPETVN